MYRQYIGARYVVKIYENSGDPSSADWEGGRAYEPLTMVTHNNSSYISKKEVPATVGDPASNPSYWVVSGLYNGQIAQLQNDVGELQQNIGELQQNSIYVTIDSFGAVGDGVTNDYNAISDALTFAQTTGVILSTKGKTYKIDQDLALDGVVFDGNNAEFLFSDEHVTLKNKATCVNLKITGAGFILEGGLNKLSDVWVNEFNDNAVELKSGDYESFVNNIRLTSYSTSNTVGVYFGGSDSKVSNVFGFGARTGIYFYGGNNFANDIHLWLTFANGISGSIFCKFRVSGNTITDYFCDSYETCFKSENTNLMLNADNGLWFNNNTLFNNMAFYLCDVDAASNLMGNILIKLTGLTAASNTFTIGNVSKMNITTIDGAATKPNHAWAPDVGTLLGLNPFNGNGFIQCDGGFLTNNMYFEFYSDRKTSLPSIDLSSIMCWKLSATVRSQARARYHDGTNWVDGYVNVNYNPNGTIDFTWPSLFAGYQMAEISFCDCIKVRV